MNGYHRYLCLVVLAITHSCVDGLKSDKLCSQCPKCDSNRCPATEAYPHMTGFDDALITGALQSHYVDSKDMEVYSVPNIKGGTSSQYNAFFGWESTSGSASGYHRFRNYMNKCSGGQSYLTVDKHGKVSLRSLKSLESLREADWKSINPPKNCTTEDSGFGCLIVQASALLFLKGRQRKEFWV